MLLISLVGPEPQPLSTGFFHHQFDIPAYDGLFAWLPVSPRIWTVQVSLTQVKKFQLFQIQIRFPYNERLNSWL